MEHLHALIMAGGSGTRFWPRSRKDRPKQFLDLTGGAPLIVETVERITKLCPRQNVWVLTRRDLVAQVKEALPWIADDRIIGEPEGRDTAPCLVLGSALVEQADPEAMLLVLPADHVIPDHDAFCDTVRGGIEVIGNDDRLVTFGVEPDHAATVYGYIKRAAGNGEAAGISRCHAVDSFREKPDRATAEEYVADGSYFWNAGIFLWKLSVFRAALEEHAPDLASGWGRLADLGAELSAMGDGVAERFGELPRISIDYALMEKARNVSVVEARFPWDDVGSWRAIERYQDADGDDNIVRGRAVAVDSKRSTVLGGDDRIVATLGLEDFLVVDTPEALLVCPRDRVDDVKKIVDALQERGWDEAL